MPRASVRGEKGAGQGRAQKQGRACVSGDVVVARQLRAHGANAMCCRSFPLSCPANRQGAATVKRLIPDCISIFVTADSEDVLVKRLVARKTEPLVSRWFLVGVAGGGAAVPATGAWGGVWGRAGEGRVAEGSLCGGFIWVAGPV